MIGGLAAETRITGSEASYDTLRVETLGGNDDVTVAPYVNRRATEHAPCAHGGELPLVLTALLSAATALPLLAPSVRTRLGVLGGRLRRQGSRR